MFIALCFFYTMNVSKKHKINNFYILINNYHFNLIYIYIYIYLIFS